MNTPNNTERVVVVGAGYAGTLAAVRIAYSAGRRADVTLVSPDGVLTQRLRMHQIATGQRIAAPDLNRLTGRRVTVARGWATEVDVDGGRVRLADGPRTAALPFDRLVLTTGSTVRVDDTPGAATHAHTLSNPRSANRLLAAWRALPEGAVVAVGGGGLTGIETATELADARPDLTVRLVTAGRLGSWMSDAGREYLWTALRRLDVQVRDGAGVTAVDRDRFWLDDGADVPFDLAVWCGGFVASPLAADAGLATDDRGSVRTDTTLRSVSHPRVVAAGDAVAPPPLPNGASYQMTCQAGLPAAAHAADTVVAELRGATPRPFDFGFIHRPISLGRGDGLIQFMHRDDTPAPRVLTGRAAALYKNVISYSPIPSIRGVRYAPGMLRWPGARATASGGTPADAAS